ncbi:MAG: hydantoinase B/oxoprolinase family protein, partial [Planctomycetales bacterium]|nr:hydantoinase B/oxoprolinase family protein [Planctomycetales bacterium]
MSAWEFWIDVGGTFTDCIGVDPDGGWHRAKELSSGRIKGRIGAGSEPAVIFDSLRANDPDDFWQGWNFTLLAADGTVVATSQVIQSTQGRLTLDAPLPNIPAEHAAYELDCHLESPVVCIRRILGLGLLATLPPLSVRLGTTRGTNALLTRQGAITAWVTTKGFGDVLRIGNQARPKLFDLHIRKPETLAPFVLEVDQRTAADGSVLQSMNEATVRRALLRLKQDGVESLAVTLLNSYVNADDEITLGQLAKEIGFTNVSLSHEVSPVIKLLSRGDTTVVDAYLSPVLHDYTRTITQQLGPHAEQLRLMTSAGGLVQADQFQGKDSILSGPAGGVVGFARIAEAAGFAHAIGFDMGGTSTDVARYDGTFEREYETEKAGVRIAAPMMAIETVAAGGGSICGFDGVKLTVGPTSAGANPGPACYGQGGPLTVTDINLFLGRLVPDALPFTLDQNVVQQRLQTLTKEIAAQTNRPLSEVELAEGFLQIANHNMAAAVRTISVAKGYDPAEYVLVSFGGAAAQHACAVAEQLNMKAILNHPDAGILSAVGMGLADVSRFATQGIYQPWSEATAQLGVDVFRTLADQATATLAAEERISPERIHLSGTIDLRYQNTDAYLTVSFDPSQPRACVELFHRQHHQLYGYETPERNVEVGQIRIEAVGQTSHALDRSRVVAGNQPQPTATTPMIIRGQTTLVPVYRRGILQAGDTFSGPAMVLEDYSTTVVDCGWQARVLLGREILLERTDDAPPERATDTATSHESDPVRLELFNRIFESIATQMGVTLQRTSCSVNVKERLDFSCALFTADGNLVVNAPHIPVHLGAMGETVRNILLQHTDIQPGDVFITNDPYHGGSHLPDVTVVTPVHDDASDELLFFTASRAHHAEIGGLTPGSMPPFSKSLAEEGVLIRSFKLFVAGKAGWQQLRDTLASGTYPSRDIDSNLADVHAQVAANQQGVRDLRRIVATYGRDTILSYMQHIQTAAEQKMKSALAAIADGDYHFEDQMRLASNVTACIRVCIRIQGEQATIDFTGTDP